MKLTKHEQHKRARQRVRTHARRKEKALTARRDAMLTAFLVASALTPTMRRPRMPSFGEAAAFAAIMGAVYSGPGRSLLESERSRDNG